MEKSRESLDASSGGFTEYRYEGSYFCVVLMPKIRPVHWKEFEKFLLHYGCEFVRERGDPRIYKKYGIKRPIVIPRDTNLPPFIILNNLRTLSISRDQYIKLIDTL